MAIELLHIPYFIVHFQFFAFFISKMGRNHRHSMIMYWISAIFERSSLDQPTYPESSLLSYSPYIDNCRQLMWPFRYFKGQQKNKGLTKHSGSRFECRPKRDLSQGHISIKRLKEKQQNIRIMDVFLEGQNCIFLGNIIFIQDLLGHVCKYKYMYKLWRICFFSNTYVYLLYRAQNFISWSFEYCYKLHT